MTATGPVSGWQHDQTLHAWYVDAGLLAGEYPAGTDPTVTMDKLELLMDAGVRTFVDLTSSADGLASYEKFLFELAGKRGLQVTHRSFPTPDLGVLEDGKYDDILSAVAAGRGWGTVYLHCWGGVGRTSTVVGCLLADRGLDADMIFDHIENLRAGTRKEKRPAPETDRQRDVVRRRADQHRTEANLLASDIVDYAWVQPTTWRQIFTPAPQYWGLRGDAVLWEAIREQLGDADLPADPMGDALDAERILREAFIANVGTPAESYLSLRSEVAVDIKAFGIGGMSSGSVHLPTWHRRLLPLLVSRLQPKHLSS